ncbi:MAG: elongation factor 4 [Candidatus Tectomicrobia bacterium]|uniref:Elongation factor 4 n=1 Tax=Tectimicrobiota bacterium TaxID=2528274 RepID=A0A932CQR7_UNCTE|nr:elongation factor 4 [Candidatus Tectomicrobia bacterium]
MQDKIRNFSIIAHIDHGKSTLADRFLEVTRTIPAREMTEQVLDDMDLERERGITIKARSVRMSYCSLKGEEYILNLIDTPGHVDFSYEVSRSLAACEGVLLVIDASQGIEAQTLANVYLALEHDLTIIPVINKIDLPVADVEKVKGQIESALGIDPSEALLASAKEGIGVREILERVIEQVPPPQGDPQGPLQALIFDSWFDSYQGAVVLVRIFQGEVRVGNRIQLMSSGKEFEVHEVGVLRPKLAPVDRLGVGEVGYLIAGIKRVSDTEVGDTLTLVNKPAPQPLPGYKEMKPMVFCGLYPVENSQYDFLRDALEKLRLNDSSFRYEPETSAALGFGFRCGFLGLLHMDIVKERLEREFGLSLIATAPTVVYQVTTQKGEMVRVENPANLPPVQEIQAIEEPFIAATIIVPHEYLGAILKLVQERRGVQKGVEYLGKDKVLLTYELPLNEIVLDFYDKLKTVSRGYASFDYEFLAYRESPLVKLDILLNGEPVDALSLIIHREKAYYQGRELVKRMREVIPRQLFEVAIQAAIGGRIIARESVAPLRKNVTAKCYGGDITRKRKLLEKQKEGKKRMKQVGKVQLPQEAFLALLKV